MADKLRQERERERKLSETETERETAGRDGYAEHNRLANLAELEQLRTQLNLTNQLVSSLKSELKRAERSIEPEYLKPNLAETAETTETAVQTTRVLKVDNITQVDYWTDLLHEETEPGARSAARGNDVTVTYQFLRRSIYYFLTDKENKDYHLRSIERLLQFSDGEMMIIDRHKPLKKF